jgi:hypothetical protein
VLKIRHCVEKSNVEKSLLVIDSLKIRHVVIKSGKILSLSGLIDPISHLNLDYPLHLVKNCIISEKFELDSKIEISNGGFIFAQVNPNSYQHYGKYDYNQNLQKMIESVKKLRNIDSNTNIKETPIKSPSSHISNNANKNI